MMGSAWSHIPLPRPIRVLSYRHAHWCLPLGDGAPILEKEDLNLRSPPTGVGCTQEPWLKFTAAATPHFHAFCHNLALWVLAPASVAGM